MAEAHRGAASITGGEGGEGGGGDSRRPLGIANIPDGEGGGGDGKSQPARRRLYPRWRGNGAVEG